MNEELFDHGLFGWPAPQSVRPLAQPPLSLPFDLSFGHAESHGASETAKHGITLVPTTEGGRPKARAAQRSHTQAAQRRQCCRFANPFVDTSSQRHPPGTGPACSFLFS